MPPKLITDQENQIGENPLWHPTEKRLYWTDIPTGRIFHYDPVTAETEQIYSGEIVGGFTFQADGGLLLFMACGKIAKWKDGKLETLIEEIPAERESRFNDVIADPQGRVFCGTMPSATDLGRLYRLDPDRSLHLLLDGINISNGLGFTPDQKTLYYTESVARKIYKFDYDAESGQISNQRTWKEIPPNEGVPDGLTVDADGFIWSARWEGSAVYKYAPSGENVQKIEIPAQKVTSITFGCENLKNLYVTTALDGGTKEEAGEGAGALFCIPDVGQGQKEYFSHIE
ncbi:MAG: SMP-30/gluconolactonase/LRE family protein [Anaerolineae bacterium]|jgi:D-xylono/L-arabinono-1,4-lactonase|nr:SMP-30/gluconolactonase/LRE family protein [Anaerolineae bacterium]MBT7189835.1 SMP-30/gluconolactonase/LRE family protein [Anaerolineae bacterium]MBT7988878.1 SMP-30/gluconolactonase/LRE family protein [Anaerolineae bacterium]